MVIQDQNATPNPGETLVDSIRILHSIAVPWHQIAKRLHVSEAAVLCVIEWGILPPTQLPLVWTDEALASGEATADHNGAYQVGKHEIPGAEVDRFQKLRDNHGVFQLGTQDADDQQAKKAPTVQHFLWWMAAVIGSGVSL